MTTKSRLALAASALWVLPLWVVRFPPMAAAAGGGGGGAGGGLPIRADPAGLPALPGGPGAAGARRQDGGGVVAARTPTTPTLIGPIRRIRRIGLILGTI